MASSTRMSQFSKQDLWTKDLSTMSWLQRVGTQVIRLATAVGMEFRHRLLDARAAGLVFTTLLSLVPFLAVMFSVLKAFGVHHVIEPSLAQALEPLGPKGQEITTTIVGFVDNIKIGVLGVVGIGGLFYTTYSLIDKIEQALNAIWQVKQGRSWGRKFSDYLSAVLVGPVLVFSAFGLLASLQNNDLVERLVEMEPFGTLVVWSGELIPFLMLCGVFTFFYKMIPNTNVEIRSALVGGVAAATLWGLAGEAFAKFVVSSAKYSAIYSGFAVVILFLLWLYVGWMIVLIGAQFSFFHQYPSAYLSRLLWEQGTFMFREQLALKVLRALGHHYLKGDRPLRLIELSNEVNLPLSLVEEEVERLVENGFVGRLQEPEGLSLIKPPELIFVKEVLDSVRNGTPPWIAPHLDSVDPVTALLRRRDRAVQKELAGETIQSLLQEQERPGSVRS
ncbi:MAG: YihY/virulence factor BrkB family protein [Nitrospira sp.]|nr:YihY/virulence factor BrkB family protein [Nitrospira sp.]MDH4242881.1 YihY/virulence factor BrkB family protein [Nitrospira sp.]MDH5318107.1 YihY/virulence factor BrkB family protein [Nitrospira sp.]